MKRTAFIIAALLIGAGAGPVEGQFGIRGGMNLSRFVGQDATDDGRTGLNLGASIPLIRVSALSIVPEVYYAQKGGTEVDASGHGSFDFELNYIEVPILAKLRLPVPGARWLHAYVAGGPAYAWNLDCRVASDSELDAAARQCGEQFQSFQTAMSSADRGVVFSGGLDFSIAGLGGVNLDARLVRGLARLREEGSTDVRNQSVSLMLGYYLGR
jgi:hypothetical protein